MSLTESGMVTEVRPDSRKASSPMEVTESVMVTECSAVQSSYAECATAVVVMMTLPLASGCWSQYARVGVMQSVASVSARRFGVSLSLYERALCHFFCFFVFHFFFREARFSN